MIGLLITYIYFSYKEDRCREVQEDKGMKKLGSIVKAVTSVVLAVCLVLIIVGIILNAVVMVVIAGIVGLLSEVLVILAVSGLAALGIIHVEDGSIDATNINVGDNTGSIGDNVIVNIKEDTIDTTQWKQFEYPRTKEGLHGQ